MSIADQLATALKDLSDAIRYTPLGVRALQELKNTDAALDAYAACPKGEVKSNRAWREECQQLRAIINRLALIPADDFYKTGDYAAGLIADAWREARDLEQP